MKKKELNHKKKKWLHFSYFSFDKNLSTRQNKRLQYWFATFLEQPKIE